MAADVDPESKTASPQDVQALTEGRENTIGDAFRGLRNDLRRRKCFERAPVVYFVRTVLWVVTFVATYFLVTCVEQSRHTDCLRHAGQRVRRPAGVYRT